MESNGTLWSEKPTWSQPDFLRWNKFKESSGSRLDQGPFFWLFATSQVLPKCFAIFMLLYCYLFCKFFFNMSQFHKLVFSLPSSSHTLIKNDPTWGCKKKQPPEAIHERYEMHEAEIQRNLIEWHLQGQSRGNTSVSLCIVKWKICRSCWKRN